MTQFDTDEIIQVKTEKLSRNYKGYKGTFATLVYNCIHKRSLPGLYYERELVADARQEDNTLSVTLSGNRPDEVLIGIMDIALENSSAFPVETDETHFSINVK